MSNAFWNETAAVVQRELDAGESLLWCGRPRAGIRVRGTDAFFIPFSIVWSAFAIFWEVMAISASAKGEGAIAFVLPVFGLVFVAMGLYMLFGRFIGESRIRAHTCYGLTNQRLLIVSGRRMRNVKSLSLRSLPDISLSERADGTGTITFFPIPTLDQLFAPVGWLWWSGWGGFNAPAFDLIDRAKDVYDLIRRAQGDNGS